MEKCKKSCNTTNSRCLIRAESASGQSQNVDDFAPRKFEVLKNYLTEHFNDNIDGDDWQLLEDVMC